MPALFILRPHRRFRGLESDLAVGSVAERLVGAPSTAAERECRLACQVIRRAVGVDQFNGSFGSFHAIWAVGPNGDLHLRHIASTNSGVRSQVSGLRS